jgi:hypothetical protein
MPGRHLGPSVRPLIHRDTVLAATLAPNTTTEHPFGTIVVDSPRTTATERWTRHSPIVENHRPNVDEPAPTVDSHIHNILWLINLAERYILWFWS